MDAVYPILAGAILALFVILPGWFLARLNRMRQVRHDVRSGPAKVETTRPGLGTARAGVATSAAFMMDDR